MTKPTRAAAGGKEQERIDEIRDDLSPLAALGPVRVRSRVGHGARGLQRRRRRLGVPAARAGAHARPTAGARTASPASATATSSSCFAPAFWNGRDPHPEGAALRRDAVRGQPRRGREGILLPPRQHADALVHEAALQVSAGGVSLRAAGRGEPAARGAGARVRAARHRHLRRRPLLRHRRSSTPRPGPEDIADPHHASPTAVPTRRRSTSCRTSGSATPGPGARSRRRPSRASRTGSRRRGSSLVADDAGVATDPYIPVQYRLGPRCLYGPDGRRARSSPTTRRTARRVYGPGNASRERVHVKDAFHRYVVDGERVRAPARAIRARRRRSTTGSTCQAGATDRAALPAHERGARRPARRRRRDRRAAQAEADEFYAAIHPPRARAPTRSTSSGRRSPGCCGRSRATSSTSRSGSTATTRTARRRSRAGRSATRTGAT